MFSATDVIGVLRDCETVLASPLLTEAERDALAGNILSTLPDASFSPYAPIVTIVQDAVRRQIDRNLSDGRAASAALKAKGRTAKGVEDTAQVDDPAEAPQGPTEGVEEQA